MCLCCATTRLAVILRGVSVDKGELIRRWSRAWPECPPIGHLFRHRMHDRWVRFHSLPLGRRRPAGVADYEEVLMRYNTVLAEVLGEYGCAATSAAERDRLAARFSTWLSDRPDGL